MAFEGLVRILAAADVHGVMSVYEWLVTVAGVERADVLVLAGDLFAADWPAGQRKQAPAIIGLLKKAAVPCFYLMGNDDHVGLEYEDDQVQPLHGRRIALAGWNLVGYQFTPPFAGTVFVKPENEIEKDLRVIGPLLDSQTVFVTHAPAHGALDRTYGGEHVGSRSLASLLARAPVLAHIHGHIHESFGRDGFHFNVASAGHRRAVLIELPSLDHRVLAA